MNRHTPSAFSPEEIRSVPLDYGGTIGARRLDWSIGQRPVDPGVVEPLRRIHATGRRLLLASDSLPCETRWPALEKAGIADLFTVALLSHALGIEKPHPMFYDLVIAAAGCSPPEILFVGDNIRKDVEAPLRAGMNAALLRPHGLRPGEQLPEGAALITCIRDLEDLL